MTELPPSGLSDDQLKRRLFPFAIRSQAKEWLNSLEPESLRTWEEVLRAFHDEYSPYSLTEGLEDHDTDLEQKEEDIFNEGNVNTPDVDSTRITLVSLEGVSTSSETIENQMPNHPDTIHMSIPKGNLFDPFCPYSMFCCL